MSSCKDINRNLKLKIHDCDLSYSFIKIAPDKHEVGAKGGALLYEKEKYLELLHGGNLTAAKSKYG